MIMKYTNLNVVAQVKPQKHSFYESYEKNYKILKSRINGQFFYLRIFEFLFFPESNPSLKNKLVCVLLVKFAGVLCMFVCV